MLPEAWYLANALSAPAVCRGAYLLTVARKALDLASVDVSHTES